MTALCALLVCAFVALLFSRIHFHFSFNLTVSRDPKVNSTRKSSTGSGKRRAEISGEVPPAVAIRPSQDEADLASALLNLGCEKKKALDVARSAMFHGQDFDTRIKWAMQNAA